MHSGYNRDYYYPNEPESYRDSRNALQHSRDHGHRHGSSHSHSHHGHDDHKSSHSHSHHRKSSKNRNPHHDRHLAEGAAVAAAVAEAIHHHRKKEGEDVSSGFGHIVRTVGAGALGAVAANEIERAHDSHRRKKDHSSSGHHDYGHGHGHGHDNGHHRHHKW
ncbi:hypothetical protein N7507_003263 [Penicillium longicatenatum]|nr:hypothetical protein N7507_003263 [Penicillium longicatenatum]